MYPCDDCALLSVCDSARTRWSSNCVPVRGVAVVDIPAPDTTDAAFWRMVADDAQAAADYAEEMATEFAAQRGIL